MTTAIYIRVSTDEQKLGLEAQEATCLKYVELRELGEIQIYADVGVSGGTPLQQRPEGALLTADIEEGQVTVVVAVRLDRLFRDVSDTLTTITAWDNRSVAVHLIDMGGAAVDTSSAVGRLMITILAGMAEFERSLIRERTAAAKCAQLARGEYRGGSVPWGFRRVESATPGAADRLLPAPMERLTVEIATDARAQGKTWDALAKQLNAQDLKNRGRPWRRDTLIRRIGGFQRRHAQ